MNEKSTRPPKAPRLTVWEKRIVAAFIERYPSSAMAALDTAVNTAPNAADSIAGKATAKTAPNIADSAEDEAAGDTTHNFTLYTAADAVPGDGEDAEVEAPPAKKPPRPQRLRPEQIFSGINWASPDDRVSFLEAAESLEARGLLTLNWARHRKGEVLYSLICRDPELLYELAGKVSPKVTAENVRGVAGLFAFTPSTNNSRSSGGKKGRKRTGDSKAEEAPPEPVPEDAAFFSFLSKNFTAQDAVGGVDVMTVVDLSKLTRFLFDRDESRQDDSPPGPLPDADVTRDPPRRENFWRGKIRGITTRALSMALYGDSKRLEALMTLLNPLLVRARRQGIAVPDFSFLDRSYPETFIAGKIVLDFKEDPVPAGEVSPIGDSPPPGDGGETAPPPENAAAGDVPPLVNAGGSILGLPLETILKLRRIRPFAGEAAVLMIENKETFFALSESLPDYSCFLYTGGHPNRAVRALVSLLAESGFSFSHAGDLDPDGILILQELAEIAGKPVKPLRMDADTFDYYLEYGRKLEPPALRRTALISEKTRAIPGMADLIRLMEETETGVEQEIIDYRG